MSGQDDRGRVCPLSYRHGAGALREAATLEAPVAWIVGGLYGNLEALTAIERRVAADTAIGQPALVFNGDFHWFDIAPEDFAAIQHRVLAHTSLAGNVEAELGAPDDTAGCGCAYPGFVDDETVERSNRIIEHLRRTASDVTGATDALANLARLLRLRIANHTTGIIHGDPAALAGWGLAVESIRGEHPATPGDTVREWARRAEVDGFACTHTCLPWADRVGGVPVINNGSAGMPNFTGHPDETLVTRIAPIDDPAPDARYALPVDGVRYEAVPIAFDDRAWRARFRANWPPGSPAHTSYWQRLQTGPAHRIADALPSGGAQAPASELG